VAELAAGRAREALRWLDAAVPTLASASIGIVQADPPFAFLHGDTRSDNLRWVKGHLYLLDWPHVSIGPPEHDAAAFAQSVMAEGGPESEEVMAWYAGVAPVRQEVLDGAVASLAGFFADAAWREDIPGLPRLRAFQRRQLRVTLAWAARRLNLPHPAWLEAVPDEITRTE
jgi:thiamine kinase-like enzyme